jgi:hypothetical protein
LNTRTYLAIFLIATSIALGTTTSIATPVSADKNSGRDNGLDKEADENVHNNVPGGLGGDIDKKFHEGLCQADISTDALDEATNGAGCDALTDPGNSDGHHK